MENLKGNSEWRKDKPKQWRNKTKGEEADRRDIRKVARQVQVSPEVLRGANRRWAITRKRSEAVARVVVARMPDIATVLRTPAARKGKVYIDYLQLGQGKTIAAPFAARLLTNAPLPKWHKEPENVKAACRQAAKQCQKRGVDIAKLALQFSAANLGITTTIAGSANPENVRKWAQWAEEPIDRELLQEVLEALAPVKDIGHVEGLPQNN